MTWVTAGAPKLRIVGLDCRARFGPLGHFCGGDIWEKPFSEYRGCTVDPLDIRAENLAEAIANLPGAVVKAKIKTRAQFLERMGWDADFRRLYPELR